ncbi:MAG TPA: NAD(P)-dependent oxidoreductase [Bryobacteraceae bacterium]|jgi:3-hydroxyisobutyrate dehydrogenase-like beta-hydroxyacid dehydrogenase
MKVGFIGLGRMGASMARNLMRAGHQLILYNRTFEKARAFAGEDAQIAGSPADSAREADAVFTMLSDDQAVSDVVFGKDGIASTLKTGAAHISSSTISTAMARKLTETHRERQQVYLSAPVFGRPEAAEAKKPIVVPAGDPPAIERFRPLFDAIGRTTFVAGTEPWQANLVKLCGNFMIASMLEAFAESFATVQKAGIQRQLFLEVMSELFGSPVYKNYGSVIAGQKFQPAGFALKLGLKDVRLALEAAQELNVPLPIGSLIRDHLLSAMAHDQAEWDWSSLALVSARSAGLP